MNRIPLIEDGQDLVATLAYNLEREGFETLRATTGSRGMELALGPPGACLRPNWLVG